MNATPVPADAHAPDDPGCDGADTAWPMPLDEACSVADEGPADAADINTPAPARLPPAADEAQLVAWLEAVVQQDERALAALYDATLARVHGLVLRIVRQPMLAEEVVEDTYFQVWRQAVRFDAQRGRALAWLLGMARSRAIDALRREGRFQHVPLDETLDGPAGADSAPAADVLLDLARRHASLYTALKQLPAQARQLVALAFLRGLSHDEIADQMALPLGTVKSQIRRALLNLRARLDEPLDPACG